MEVAAYPVAVLREMLGQPLSLYLSDGMLQW